MENNIIHSNGIWMTKAEYDAWCKLESDFWFGKLKKRELRDDNNVKLALVEINGKRTMIGVDNKTMKGYELNETIPTWKYPLISLEYDKFERWCTTFDV